MHFRPFLVACVFITNAAVAAIHEPVKLDSGLISGVAGSNADIRVFKGIPYAAPPVGDRRWRPPQPVAPWTGVRNADHFSAICPQVLPPTNTFYGMEYFLGPQPAMDEDCLYLNVWTAAKSSTERRPVMVWIHGGGNVQGYGSETCFDGEAFARKGVVLVTINYRLGIFSCFAHPELSAESPQHVSGNYGELDQIAALRWVQKNIDGYVLPNLAVNIFSRRGQTAMPMLIGSTSDEGSFSPIKGETFRADVQKRFGAVTNDFFKLYPADTDDQAAQSKHDERRDESAAGERAEAASQAALGQPVWLYYFDRKPPGRDREKYGAFHAAELEYVFNTQNVTDRPWEEVDRKLANAMISYWSNFAATGNPNGPGLPTWPAYDPKSDTSMELGETIAPRPIPNREQLDFLKTFLDQDAK